MLQMKNLRYLVCEENGRIRTEAHIQNPPEGVCLGLTAGEWLYKGGQFNIGSGVRVDNDNNLLPGVMFIFDWTNAEQRRRAAMIIYDAATYGRLVNA